MFRITIALVFGGAMLMYLGISEYRVSMGTTVEPVLVDLAELEGGTSLTNNHVAFGKHFCNYAHCIYQYRDGESGRSLDHVYYPILSESHPYFSRIAGLASNHGGKFAAIPGEELPPIKSFKVLVKTSRFKTPEQLHEGITTNYNLQGLVSNIVSDISDREKELIREAHPDLDFGSVLIVEENRKPASAIKSLAMILGGAVLSLLGIGRVLLAMRRPKRSSQ